MARSYFCTCSSAPLCGDDALEPAALFHWRRRGAREAQARHAASAMRRRDWFLTGHFLLSRGTVGSGGRRNRPMWGRRITPRRGYPAAGPAIVSPWQMSIGGSVMKFRRSTRRPANGGLPSSAETPCGSCAASHRGIEHVNNPAQAKEDVPVESLGRQDVPILALDLGRFGDEGLGRPAGLLDLGELGRDTDLHSQYISAPITWLISEPTDSPAFSGSAASSAAERPAYPANRVQAYCVKRQPLFWSRHDTTVS